MTTGLTWNLVDDIRQLLSFHFMLNALRAGTIVAVVAGAIGYLMVLRRQSFAGHTLAILGFPGAAGATWLGFNAAFGYFGFCVAGALIISALPGGGRRTFSSTARTATETPPRRRLRAALPHEVCDVALSNSIASRAD